MENLMNSDVPKDGYVTEMSLSQEVDTSIVLILKNLVCGILWILNIGN